MTFQKMTADERAVLAEADRVGLAPDSVGVARSRFIGDLRRDVNATRAMVVAAARLIPAPTSIAAASVKSTDKPRTPATVSRERAKPSSGTQPKVTTERIKPHSATVVSPSPTRAAALATPPTEYPASWARGRRAVSAGAGRRAATITAAAGVNAQRAAQAHQPAQAVHAAGDTGRLIRATQQREAERIAAGQRDRFGTGGHHNPHNLIAAAGGNAQRIQDAQRADQQRMAREQAARAARPLGR